MDTLARLAPEELLDRALHERHARHAADQDHIFDLVLAETSFFKRLLTGLDGAVYEIARELFELRTAEHALQMQRFVARIRDDER
jgi:hypothetical protein